MRWASSGKRPWLSLSWWNALMSLCSVNQGFSNTNEVKYAFSLFLIVWFMRYLFWLKLWVSETLLIWFTNCFFSFKLVLLFHVGPSRFFTGNEIPRSFLNHSSRGKFSKWKCGIKALYRESPRSSQCHECYHWWPREFGWVKKLERMLFIPMRRGSYRYICLRFNEGGNEMSKLNTFSQ